MLNEDTNSKLTSLNTWLSRVTNRKSSILNNMIFICYRRDDSSGYARQIYSDLSSSLGQERIFFDYETLYLGDDYPKVINNTIASCKFLIVIIGKNWLNTVNGAVRRLEDPKNFVRREILAAIDMKVELIPILVQGATMPGEEDLPEELKLLASSHALDISDSRWGYDMGILITKLSPSGSRSRKKHRGSVETGIAILNLIRKLIAIIIIFISFLYLFFRKDVIEKLLFTDESAPVQDLFFPLFLLVTGIFIFLYKIK